MLGGAPTTAASRPNFVFVQFEGTGAGWASTSVAMDDRRPEAKGPAGLTPALERLAAEGMRFSGVYVSAPRGTPARATFLTGIGAAKLGMTYVTEGGHGRRPQPRRRGTHRADARATCEPPRVPRRHSGVLRGRGKGAVARPREESVVHVPRSRHDLASDPGEQRNLAAKERSATPK